MWILENIKLCLYYAYIMPILCSVSIDCWIPNCTVNSLQSLPMCHKQVIRAKKNLAPVKIQTNWTGPLMFPKIRSLGLQKT